MFGFFLQHLERNITVPPAIATRNTRRSPNRLHIDVDTDVDADRIRKRENITWVSNNVFSLYKLHTHQHTLTHQYAYQYEDDRP